MTTVYRGGGEWGAPKDASALDVVTHEEEVLGNTLSIDAYVRAVLEDIPARDIRWVSPLYAVAARYGYPVEQIPLSDDHIVLARDGDDGLLVWTPNHSHTVAFHNKKRRPNSCTELCQRLAPHLGDIAGWSDVDLAYRILAITKALRDISVRDEAWQEIIAAQTLSQRRKAVGRYDNADDNATRSISEAKAQGAVFTED